VDHKTAPEVYYIRRNQHLSNTFPSDNKPTEQQKTQKQHSQLQV